MDFSKMNANAKRKLARANFLASEAKKLREEAYEEFEKTGFTRGHVTYKGIRYTIFKTNEYVSRIYDSKFLNEFFGKDADKYKKDCFNKATFTIKKGVE